MSNIGEMEENRASLYILLKLDKKQYIINNWQPKEVRIIKDFIERYFNLRIYEISRNEGMHSIVKDIINF